MMGERALARLGGLDEMQRQAAAQHLRAALRARRDAEAAQDRMARAGSAPMPEASPSVEVAARAVWEKTGRAAAPLAKKACAEAAESAGRARAAFARCTARGNVLRILENRAAAQRRQAAARRHELETALSPAADPPSGIALPGQAELQDRRPPS